MLRSHLVASATVKVRFSLPPETLTKSGDSRWENCKEGPLEMKRPKSFYSHILHDQHTILQKSNVRILHSSYPTPYQNYYTNLFAEKIEIIGSFWCLL